jgi:hypothetical protein
VVPRVRHRRAFAGLVTVAAILTAVCPASAVARASHTSNWSTSGAQVVCGIVPAVPGTAFDPGVQAPLNGRWPGLQCSAAGIPRPRQGVGDPFVQLGQGRSGRARLVDESQDDLSSSAPFKRLAPGSTWSADGIVCAVRSGSVRCTNSAGHGFTLASGHVRLF